MPAPWQALFDKLEATVDTYIGEQVTVVPMLAGDFGTRPDPDRPSFDATGLVYDQHDVSEVPEKMQGRIPHEEMHVLIQWSQLPAGASVRKDDKVLLRDRPHAPPLLVARPARLDAGRLTLVCAAIKD